MTLANSLPKLVPDLPAHPSRHAVHFSSATDQWATPQDLFDKLNAEFNFNLDVCASADDAKCASCFTKIDNGLKQSWQDHTCWMNPPYGRNIGEWVQKAYIETAYGEVNGIGCRVVALLPARPDTQWWHRFVMRAYERRFIRGRLKFGGATNSAPFPSVIVVF